MINITIGIVAKDAIINNNSAQIVTKSHLKYLNNKCNIIAILNYDNSIIDTELLNKCDGIIFQGGNDIYPYHFQILNYCLKNNIPILGICMGHQIMGLYSIKSIDEQDLIPIEGHQDKQKMHKIITVKESFLNKSLGDSPLVNTRHSFAIDKVKSPFQVTAISEDNVIEGIEYIDQNHFAVGVQFHPEDLNTTENLYNNFLKEVIKRKK